MQCGSETQKGTHYKVKGRKVKAAFREVGGGHNTVDRRDSRTLREGRSPALSGAYSDEEGLVTAKGRSPLAQRTRRNVQVLQNKLRFQIVFDIIEGLLKPFLIFDTCHHLDITL